MRHLIWISILAAFTQAASVAYAQLDNGTKSGMYDAGPSGVPPPGFKPDNFNPTNCGTPDDSKVCGPMPRRPLGRYPVGR
jgi:hypothetical protein